MHVQNRTNSEYQEKFPDKYVIVGTIVKLLEQIIELDIVSIT